MGTKNNPGKYDCYHSAHPDEPMFILLGRDPVGASLVRLWAEARESLKPGDSKIQEALECAEYMESWCIDPADRKPANVLALLPYKTLQAELERRGATVTPLPHGGDFETQKTAPEYRPATHDELIISELILSGIDGARGVICSGLTQDFKNSISSFDVRHGDGSVFTVSIKISEQ